MFRRMQLLVHTVTPTAVWLNHRRTWMSNCISKIELLPCQNVSGGSALLVKVAHGTEPSCGMLFTGFVPVCSVAGQNNRTYIACRISYCCTGHPGTRFYCDFSCCVFIIMSCGLLFYWQRSNNLKMAPATEAILADVGAVGCYLNKTKESKSKQASCACFYGSTL